MIEKKLPEGWEWRKLGDIGVYINGKAFKPSEWGDIGKPIVRIQNLTDTSKDFNYYNGDVDSKYLIDNGDILVSWSASLGVFLWNGGEAVLNQHIFKAIPNEEIVTKNFFTYALRTVIEGMKRYTHGSTMKHIVKSDFDNTIMPIPPLDIQHKIVAILEKAEATQRLRAEADALTRSLSESAFINLFGNPLENPFGWKVKRLEDVSEIVSGVTKGRKFKDQVTIWVPYLRVANVQDGYLDLAEIKEIEVLESDVDKYALNPGDVLLTEGGDRDKLGRGAVWNGEAPLCLHQNHIFRVRVNPELLIPEYLSMLTGSTYGKMYFLKSAKQTTGIASINSTQLKNFPTYLPPLELQYEFSEFVKRVEELKRKQSGSKQRITMLFESLTNNVFSGEMTA